jgi:hypothetical protein
MPVLQPPGGKTLVRRRGHEMEKVYFYYASSPKCAKHFGANRVVLLAKVD